MTRPGRHRENGPGWEDGRVAVQCLCGRDVVAQPVDDYDAGRPAVCGADCDRVPALSRERRTNG